MITALRAYGLPRLLATALVASVPAALVVLVGVMLSTTVLGTGLAVIGVVVIVFARWLYHQPVPEQAAWEASLVTGVLVVAGGLMIVGGLGMVAA